MDNEAIDVRWEVVQADEVTGSNADQTASTLHAINDESAQDYSMLGTKSNIHLMDSVRP